MEIPGVKGQQYSRYSRLFLNLSSSDLPKQCNLFLYQSTVILDADMWNVYKPSERTRMFSTAF